MWYELSCPVYEINSPKCFGACWNPLNIICYMLISLFAVWLNRFFLTSQLQLPGIQTTDQAGIVDSGSSGGGGLGLLCLEADVGNSWQKQSLLSMCAILCVCIYKGQQGVKESKIERERERRGGCVCYQNPYKGSKRQLLAWWHRLPKAQYSWWTGGIKGLCVVQSVRTRVGVNGKGGGWGNA